MKNIYTNKLHFKIYYNLNNNVLVLSCTLKYHFSVHTPFEPSLASVSGCLCGFIWGGISELSFRQHKRAWSTEGHGKGRRVVKYTYSDAGRKNKGVCADSCTCWLPHLLSGVPREKRGSAGPCDTSAPCLGLLNRDTEGTEASCQSKTPQPRCASNRGHRKPTSTSVSAFVCLCGFVFLSLSHFLYDVQWEFALSSFSLRSHAVHTLIIKLIQCEERGLISVLHWGSFTMLCEVWGEGHCVSITR